MQRVPDPGSPPWLPHPLMSLALPVTCAIAWHLVGWRWSYGSLIGSALLLVYLRIWRWRMARWQRRLEEWTAYLLSAGILTQTELDGLRNMHRGM